MNSKLETRNSKLDQVDLPRRRKVMARSQKLGHCICEPSKPCPCDTLITHNICPCAGERMPAAGGSVALTKLVKRAGCASKIGQGDLKRILAGLPEISDPNILVGTAAGDDAGVYRLSDSLALVQTVDVFTPVVDDPHLFGRIAAANSLSDVYAMGGRPLSALSIIGFPIDELDGSIMQSILAGGIATLEEAGCALVGGHSINDAEIKCGFAVTGVIDPARVIERGRARAGDLLVLTKPLGTGMIAFAVQIGRLDPAWLDLAGESMATLNRDAAELMAAYGAHACTDVTGFGLAGHLVEMARTSGVAVELDLEALPVFGAVPDCLGGEWLSGAIERNQEYAMAWIRAERADARLLPLLYDPQTSGGLLVSLPAERAQDYVDALHARGHGAAAIVGRVRAAGQDEPAGTIHVAGQNLRNIIGPRELPSMEKPTQSFCGDTPAAAEQTPCCANPPELKEPAESDALAQFQEFMKAVNRPGALGAREKKLVAIALSIALRCEPCLISHLRGARAQRIPQPEIDEAANLAISFGGCTALMFYREVVQRMEGSAKGS